MLIWLVLNYCKEKKMKVDDLHDYRRKKRTGIELKEYCYGEFKDNEIILFTAHIISLILYPGLSIVTIVTSETGQTQVYAVLIALVCLLMLHILSRPFISKFNIGLMIVRHIILVLFVAVMALQRFINLSQNILHDLVGNIMTKTF